jgi:hypothetical protein
MVVVLMMMGVEDPLLLGESRKEERGKRERKGGLLFFFRPLLLLLLSWPCARLGGRRVQRERRAWGRVATGVCEEAASDRGSVFEGG